MLSSVPHWNDALSAVNKTGTLYGLLLAQLQSDTEIKVWAEFH